MWQQEIKIVIIRKEKQKPTEKNKGDKKTKNGRLRVSIYSRKFSESMDTLVFLIKDYAWLILVLICTFRWE